MRLPSSRNTTCCYNVHTRFHGRCNNVKNDIKILLYLHDCLIGNTIWRNVVISDHLTDEGLKGEILITLSYLSAAQRIGCTIVKAKNLILTANDKDLYVKITLLCRDEEQQSVVTNFTEISQNPEFNREFIFRFDDLRHASIDGIALRFDVMAREIGIMSRDRTFGRCIIGNSNLVERPGKEHWVSCLTSPKSVTQWHQLKDV